MPYISIFKGPYAYQFAETAKKPKKHGCAFTTLSQLAQAAESGKPCVGKTIQAVAKQVFDGYEARYTHLSEREKFWHKVGAFFHFVHSYAKVRRAYETVLQSFQPENRIRALLKALVIQGEIQPLILGELVRVLEEMPPGYVASEGLIRTLDNCLQLMPLMKPFSANLEVLYASVARLCHRFIFPTREPNIDRVARKLEHPYSDLRPTFEELSSWNEATAWESLRAQKSRSPQYAYFTDLERAIRNVACTIGCAESSIARARDDLDFNFPEFDTEILRRAQSALDCLNSGKLCRWRPLYRMTADFGLYFPLNAAAESKLLEVVNKAKEFYDADPRNDLAVHNLNCAIQILIQYKQRTTPRIQHSAWDPLLKCLLFLYPEKNEAPTATAFENYFYARLLFSQKNVPYYKNIFSSVMERLPFSPWLEESFDVHQKTYKKANGGKRDCGADEWWNSVRPDRPKGEGAGAASPHAEDRGSGGAAAGAGTAPPRAEGHGSGGAAAGAGARRPRVEEREPTDATMKRPTNFTDEVATLDRLLEEARGATFEDTLDIILRAAVSDWTKAYVLAFDKDERGADIPSPAAFRRACVCKFRALHPDKWAGSLPYADDDPRIRAFRFLDRCRKLL